MNLLPRITAMLFSGLAILFCSACFNDVYLFSNGPDPMRERTLSGSGREKVLLISVDGVISMTPPHSILNKNRFGMVQEIISQLNKAAEDEQIKSVVLLINSPGGSVTASDILYKELLDFKTSTGKKLYVCMFDICASGGYYAALPADLIFAHPTSLTGSVGVLFLRPEINGLLTKIGVSVKAEKSGNLKDMGSPFRAATPEEQKIFASQVDSMAESFLAKVRQHRKVSVKDMDIVAAAGVFTAEEALKLKLIDRIGYLPDVLAVAKPDKNSRVVVYRRRQNFDDNPYNMRTESSETLIETGIVGHAVRMNAGFYYLWPAYLP